MNATLKNMTKVAGATMGSRVLGLVRDQVTFAILGVGALSSSFLFAFNLPNLFRRMTGEGALTSAMIPVLTSTREKSGEAAAFEFVNKVFSRTLLTLVGFTILGIAICAAAYACSHERLYTLSAIYSMLLLPYMILICLAAVVSGALNTLGIFGVPSVGPMLLNVCMIFSLLCGAWIFPDNLEYAVAILCGGVLFGGGLQLGLPAWFLRKKGWRFRFTLAPSAELSELMRLFVPALAGAAVIQVNILISKLLALFIDNTAVSALYLSSRLVELPLGVFTFTIATVYFPKLALLSHAGKPGAFLDEYRRGMAVTLAITIPAALGLAVLSADVLGFLFEWGAFRTQDVALITPILAVSALGIPFYSMATFATRGFHSRKDTRTPLRVSVVAFAVNIGACVTLMWHFGALGLAAANVISAIVQSFMLSRGIRRECGGGIKYLELGKILFAALLMAGLILLLKAQTPLLFEGKLLSLANCLVLVPLGVILYAAALKLSGFEETKDLLRLFKRNAD